MSSSIKIHSIGGKAQYDVDFLAECCLLELKRNGCTATFDVWPADVIRLGTELLASAADAQDRHQNAKEG